MAVLTVAGDYPVENTESHSREKGIYGFVRRCGHANDELDVHWL